MNEQAEDILIESEAPPDDEAVAKGGWQPFLVVAVVFAIAQSGLYLTVAALPLYLHDLGAAPVRIGFEVGLANLTALVATLAVGPIINRRGARLFLVIGAGCYLVAALGMLFLRSEAAVTVLRAVQGLGTAAILPAAYTLAARLLPQRRATALGVMGSLTSVALAIGPPVGLALYSRAGATWLTAPAAAVSGLGLLTTLFLPDVPTRHPPARGFGFDRAWVPVLVANALQVMYFGGIIAYLPLTVQRLHGPNAGIFFTADAVGVLLLRLPTGMMVDRAGSLLPKIVGLALTLPGIAVLALPPSILTLILSGACTGVGAGLILTGILADLASLSNEGNRGTAMSLSGATFSAGIFIGSSTAGLLIGPGGFNAVLVFGIITCLATFPFALVRGYHTGG